MILIKEIGFKITNKGWKVIWCIFLCSYCLQEVERQKSNGLKQKSCGCIHNKKQNNANFKHGETKTRLYRIWKGMKTRCYNKNRKQFKDWGGRGITICPEWAESYIVFRDWALNNGYVDNLQINRKNNDGNYEPNNCNFITRTENMRNKTNTITMEIVNEIRALYATGKYTQQELVEKFNVSRSTIYKIINNKI